MKVEWKIKKSAGVPVTPAVHRLIARGNGARSAGDWAGAAEAYRAALAASPDLYHIWIQLGHALNQSDRFDEAEAAYRQAAELRPDSGDPWLHIGHMFKRSDRRHAAARHYATALGKQGVEDDAEDELARLVMPVATFEPGLLRTLVRENDPAPIAPPAPAEPVATAGEAIDAVMAALRGGSAEGAAALRSLADARDRLGAIAANRAGAGDEPVLAIDRPLVFDITDLVAHFRNHRLPTGIQRVQIEVLATALRSLGHERVGICCFIDGRDDWMEIPVARFLHLARLASSDSDAADPEWVRARAGLFLNLGIDEHFTFPMRAILVNLGTSWWIYDYFLLVRNAKERFGISYIPFVHDFIPIMAPEHCVRGVVEDYVSWAVGVFQHADFFLVNSQSTRADLQRVAARLGHDVPADRIEVVPLDADFRQASVAPLGPEALRPWGLEGEPFALFVSTIEARKNHLLAFNAWAEMLRAHDPERVPRLVCVGRNGWMNDAVFARLSADPLLRDKVTIIHQVSDEELALLYRSCRFTVYPSHYEGWGLPITESLCYGKVPVAADNSSLPEAGAGLAVLFQSDSVSAMVRAVEQVAFDDAWRAEQEARIAREFSPRPWSAVAAQINAAIARFANKPEQAGPVSRAVRRGVYYPVSLFKEARIWRGLASGEIFRAGDGWLWPEPMGCRTAPEGGELRITPEEGDGETRLYLRLRGLEHAHCPFTVEAEGRTVTRGVLRAGECRWVAGDLSPGEPGREVAVTIRGGASETIRMSTGGTEKNFPASVTVVGFLVCDGADPNARATFLEAAALGDIETISAYRDVGNRAA